MCPIISAAELGGDFEQRAVPEGEWEQRISFAKYGDSKAGNKQLSISANIEGASEYDPPSVWTYLAEPIPHTQHYKRDMRKLQVFLKAVGWKKDFDMENDAQELIGLVYTLPLKQRMYNGKMSNEIAWPN